MQQPVPASFFGKDTRNPSFILASTLCLGVGRSPRPRLAVFCFLRLHPSRFPGDNQYIPPPRRICFGGVLAPDPGPGSSCAVQLPHSNQTERTGNRRRQRRRRRNRDPTVSNPDRRLDLTTTGSTCSSNRNHASIGPYTPDLTTTPVRHHPTRPKLNTHIPAPVSPRPILIPRPAGVSAHHS